MNDISKYRFQALTQILAQVLALSALTAGCGVALQIETPESRPNIASADNRDFKLEGTRRTDYIERRVYHADAQSVYEYACTFVATANIAPSIANCRDFISKMPHSTFFQHYDKLIAKATDPSVLAKYEADLAALEKQIEELAAKVSSDPTKIEQEDLLAMELLLGDKRHAQALIEHRKGLVDYVKEVEKERDGLIANLQSPSAYSAYAPDFRHTEFRDIFLSFRKAQRKAGILEASSRVGMIRGRKDYVVHDAKTRSTFALYAARPQELQQSSKEWEIAPLSEQGTEEFGCSAVFGKGWHYASLGDVDASRDVLNRSDLGKLFNNKLEFWAYKRQPGSAPAGYSNTTSIGPPGLGSFWSSLKGGVRESMQALPIVCVCGPNTEMWRENSEQVCQKMQEL